MLTLYIDNVHMPGPLGICKLNYFLSNSSNHGDCNHGNCNHNTNCVIFTITFTITQSSQLDSKGYGKKLIH